MLFLAFPASLKYWCFCFFQFGCMLRVLNLAYYLYHYSVIRDFRITVVIFFITIGVKNKRKKHNLLFYSCLYSFVFVFIFCLFFFSQFVSSVPFCTFWNNLLFSNQFIYRLLNLSFWHTFHSFLYIAHRTYAIVF